MNQPMPKPFNLERALAGDPVITRKGHPVPTPYYSEEIATEYPVITVINGGWGVYTKNGKYAYNGKEHPNDLFMLPTKTKLHYVTIQYRDEPPVTATLQSEEAKQNYLNSIANDADTRIVTMFDQEVFL